MGMTDKLGLAIESDTHFKLSDLGSDSVQVLEATLMPRSVMRGKTLRQLNFRDRYNMSVLAIWRQGKLLFKRLGDVKLQVGDSLLLKGPRQRIPEFRESYPFVVLESMQVESQRREKIPVMLGIMALVLILATFAKLHISTALVIGSLLSVLTGVRSEERH